MHNLIIPAGSCSFITDVFIEKISASASDTSSHHVYTAMSVYKRYYRDTTTCQVIGIAAWVFGDKDNVDGVYAEGIADPQHTWVDFKLYDQTAGTTFCSYEHTATEVSGTGTLALFRECFGSGSSSSHTGWTIEDGTAIATLLVRWDVDLSLSTHNFFLYTTAFATPNTGDDTSSTWNY